MQIKKFIKPKYRNCVRLINVSIKNISTMNRNKIKINARMLNVNLQMSFTEIVNVQYVAERKIIEKEISLED